LRSLCRADPSDNGRYSEIEPGVWIGACPGERSPAFAQAILNLFGLKPYPVSCAAYREERLLDLDVPDRAVLHELADWVHTQREQGRTVLVHCQEGRNRSALVVGLYLVRYRGLRGTEAIELIRQKRGASALYNGAFERYLRSLTPERARIVDLGPEMPGARFVIYYDDEQEIGSQHQTLPAAYGWINAVERGSGHPIAVLVESA
jgi:hypothetical protein